MKELIQPQFSFAFFVFYYLYYISRICLDSKLLHVYNFIVLLYERVRWPTRLESLTILMGWNKSFKINFPFRNSVA